MTEHTPDYQKRLRPETFAASTGHGIEYGVTFCDEETPEGEVGVSYGDLITMVDERADAAPERIEQALAETMAFAQEVARRWNAHAEMLAALEGLLPMADALLRVGRAFRERPAWMVEQDKAGEAAIADARTAIRIAHEGRGRRD